MERKVRVRRKGRTRLSAKNQATIPVDALKRAGLKPGDVLNVEAEGPGRIVLTREEDIIALYCGAMPDVYPDNYLEDLRAEWR